MGLRDYAMFLLIATYGLRASEVVAISLDDIRWRQGSLRIHQRKDLIAARTPIDERSLRSPRKALAADSTNGPISEGLPPNARAHRSTEAHGDYRGLSSVGAKERNRDSFQGPHCLRHSLAVQLLKNGTPLKTIGDILGHRTAESTSVYLRLATGDSVKSRFLCRENVADEQGQRSDR